MPGNLCNYIGPTTPVTLADELNLKEPALIELNIRDFIASLQRFMNSKPFYTRIELSHHNTHCLLMDTFDVNRIQNQGSSPQVLQEYKQHTGETLKRVDVDYDKV